MSDTPTAQDRRIAGIVRENMTNLSSATAAALHEAIFERRQGLLRPILEIGRSVSRDHP